MLKVPNKKRECIICKGRVSESSYYSGASRCRSCYLLDKKKKSSGRTPNTECADCKKPLYKSPNLFSSKSVFRCGDCSKLWRSSLMKSHPERYKAIVKLSKSIKNTGAGRYNICQDCGGRKTRKAVVCKKCCYKYKSRENSYNWKGGITGINRLERAEFSRTVRKQVLERDDYTCQMCGEKGCELQVDHIQSWAEYVELRFDINNCRTLCVNCHYKITFGREKPEGVTVWGHRLSQIGG